MKNIKKLFVTGILTVGFGLCFWNLGAEAMSNKFKSSSLKYNSQTFSGEKQKRGIVRSAFISFEDINIIFKFKSIYFIIIRYCFNIFCNEIANTDKKE